QNQNKVEQLAPGLTELLHADYDGNAAQLKSVVGQPMGDFYAHPVLTNAKGEKIVRPDGIYAVDPNSMYKVGNAMPLRNIPVGSTIHCIELQPGKGAQIARSAGTSVQLLAREGSYAQLRLRSGEVRRVHVDDVRPIGVRFAPRRAHWTMVHESGRFVPWRDIARRSRECSLRRRLPWPPRRATARVSRAQWPTARRARTDTSPLQ
ncbi:MAG: hypothetical protein EBY07_14610, partial [Actinobacteria bacterium]|nr:hypothetical protein [Actinomycetota bacterium]